MFLLRNIEKRRISCIEDGVLKISGSINFTILRRFDWDWKIWMFLLRKEGYLGYLLCIEDTSPLISLSLADSIGIEKSGCFYWEGKDILDIFILVVEIQRCIEDTSPLISLFLANSIGIEKSGCFYWKEKDILDIFSILKILVH